MRLSVETEGSGSGAGSGTSSSSSTTVPEIEAESGWADAFEYGPSGSYTKGTTASISTSGTDSYVQTLAPTWTESGASGSGSGLGGSSDYSSGTERNENWQVSLTKPNFGAIGLTALAGSRYSGSSEAESSSSDSSSGEGELEVEVVSGSGGTETGGGETGGGESGGSGSGTGSGSSYSTGGSYNYSYSFSDSGFYAWGYSYEYSNSGTGPVGGAIGDGKIRWNVKDVSLGGGDMNFPESSPPQIDAPDLSLRSIKGLSELGEKRWDSLSRAEAFWNAVDAVEDAFAWAGDQVRELFDNAARWIEDAGIWATETFGWDGFEVAGSFIAGFTSAAGELLGSMVDIPGAIHGVVDAISNMTTSDLLDGLQGALDIVGLIPVVGEFADGINGVVSLARGDYVGAALSFTSMIPVVGDAIGKGGKAARFVASKADDVMALGRKIKCKVTGTGCFVAGTKVWVSARTDDQQLSNDLDSSPHGAVVASPRTITKQAIESIAIGSRVSGENPRPWEHDGELPDPISSSWKLAKFSLQKRDGNWIDVEMIRPAEYWEEQEASIGNYVHIEFPELEASGLARIKSIEPCPAIADGNGNVVTARIVTRQVSELVEIELGNGETITGTPQHPVWSIEQQEWIDLGELEVGEHLWTEEGPIEIAHCRFLSTSESVYNIEVHGHHIYQIGELGVLVHNAKACRFKKSTRKKPKSTHGNSNDSLEPTILYELRSTLTKRLRKIGITADKAHRYTKKWLRNHKLKMHEIANGTRKAMHALENKKILAFVKKHGKRPDLNRNNH